MTALFALSAMAESATLNIGSFNIRMITSSDTGSKAWNKRKEYVAKTITDFGYHVIGLNEMLSGQQEQDMKDLLPEYTFVAWGYDKSDKPNAGSKNAVAFRTDEFELLDNGHYFLGPDSDKVGQVWDSSDNRRSTVWVKLRVKETGEVLYYFVTHLDHQGSDARNEGTRLNMEMVRAISGHYPAVICGDHNSSPVRRPFYDLCSSYMEDCREVSETPFPWSQDGTLNKWDPEKKDGSRLDFIWVKGMKVHTYNHINETFGRTITPSDHFAVIANVTLKPYQSNHTRYVDIHAAEGGDGSMNAPFRDIQDAINATCKGDTIYVAQGDYVVTESAKYSGRKATLNVSHSLDIFGGYDSDFKEVVGHTVLSGDLSGNDQLTDEGLSGTDDNAYRVVTVQEGCAVELRNFEIVGGNAYGSLTSGAGIACLGNRLILDNVIVRDNRSSGNGAGVYAAGQLLCRDCSFLRNESAQSGGAYYAAYPNASLWWRYEMRPATSIARR